MKYDIIFFNHQVFFLNCLGVRRTNLQAKKSAARSIWKQIQEVDCFLELKLSVEIIFQVELRNLTSISNWQWIFVQDD